MRQLILAQTAFHPESSQRLLRMDEVKGLTPFQLRVMRNEIYARHGYVFGDLEMRNYFEKQPWYREDTAFTVDRLSTIELQNVGLIAKYESDLDQQVPATNSHTPSRVEALSAKDSVMASNAMSSAQAGTDSTRIREYDALIGTWGQRYAKTKKSQLYRVKYRQFDVDNDGDQDVLTIFGFVQNDKSTYGGLLVLFENYDGVLVYRARTFAGSAGDWIAKDIVRGTGGVIVISTVVWLPNDKACCPNGQGSELYSFDGTNLQKVSSRDRKGWREFY